MQDLPLDILYREAASRLNDGCRGAEGTLRNATACQLALLQFDAGLERLDSSGYDANPANANLFVRGRNIASRAVAYHSAVDSTAEQMSAEWHAERSVP